MAMFIREKKVDCTNYREVDIIPRTDSAEKAVKGVRGKRTSHKVTEPKQKDGLAGAQDGADTRLDCWIDDNCKGEGEDQPQSCGD